MNSRAVVTASLALLLAPLYEGGSHFYSVTPLRLALLLAALFAIVRARDTPLLRTAAAIALATSLTALYGLAIAVYPATAQLWFANALAAAATWLLACALDDHDRDWLLVTTAFLAPLLALVALTALFDPALWPFQLYGLTDPLRRYSLTDPNPNRLAALMILPAAVGTTWLIDAITTPAPTAHPAATARDANSRPRLVLAAAALLAPALTLAAATQSRAGVTAVLLACALTLFFRLGDRVRPITLLAATLALTLVGGAVLASRLAEPGDLFRFFRIRIWADALQLFAAYPTGVGLGSYGYFSAPFRDPQVSVSQYAYIALSPHSLALQWLTEYGLVGILSAIAMTIVIVRRLPSLTNARRRLRDNPLAAAAAAALAALCIPLMVGTEVENLIIVAHALIAAATLFAALFTAPLTTPLTTPHARASSAPADNSPTTNATAATPSRLRLALVLALFGALIFTATKTPQAAIAHAFSQRAALAANDPTAREEWLQRARDAHPENATHAMNYARFCFNLYDATGSEDAFACANDEARHALTLNPRSFANVAELAQFWLARAARLVTANDTPENRAALQLALTETDRYARAAIALDPFIVGPHETLLELALLLGNVNAALDTARHIVALEPNALRARMFIAATLHQLANDARPNGTPTDASRELDAAARAAFADLSARATRLKPMIDSKRLLPYEQHLTSIDFNALAALGKELNLGLQ